MSLRASKDHCYLCYDSLHSALTNQPPPPLPNDDYRCPLFVTWNKNGNLRGCIGNLNPIPLLSGLRDYAIKAGLEDSRFKPMTVGELEQCEVGVSLLVEFEECESWDDWQVGLHGIVLNYKNYRATFLPEVAKDQGWNNRQTLEALLRKAGVQGGTDENVLKECKVQRYQSSKMKASYEEWKQSREGKQKASLKG